MSSMLKKPKPPFTNSSSTHSTIIQARPVSRQLRHAYPKNTSAIISVPGSTRQVDMSVPSMYMEPDSASIRKG